MLLVDTCSTRHMFFQTHDALPDTCSSRHPPGIIALTLSDTCTPTSSRHINLGFAAQAYWWASGASFLEVVEMNPQIQEGIVVRTLVRLEELIRKLKQIAVEMGHWPLAKLCTDSCACIKRDIVFLPSLYFD